MARSIQEQLDSVDALIEQLEARKTASLTVKQMTRVDKELNPLYAERARLQQRVDEAGSNVGGSMASVGRINRPC